MRFVLIRNRPINRKTRRHSGRRIGNSTIKMPKKWIIDHCLEPHEFWDDWTDHRDGYRDFTDRKKIYSPKFHRHCEWYGVPIWNKKNKKLVKRRKLRKWR